MSRRKPTKKQQFAYEKQKAQIICAVTAHLHLVSPHRQNHPPCKIRNSKLLVLSRDCTGPVSNQIVGYVMAHISAFSGCGAEAAKPRNIYISPKAYHILAVVLKCCS